MTGNATYRLHNTTVLSVCGVEPPVVMTSAAFDEQLAGTYKRLTLRPGMLQKLSGIVERRWWPDDVTFADAASMAGAKALAEAGVDPSQVGVVINTSVCRANLEPSSAVAVHHQLDLPTACLNFDVANACLGFVNGMQLAGSMIDAGHAEYALVVDAEGISGLQRASLERMASPDVTHRDMKEQFATLTLGSGAAAMVLGRADRHPEGHRLLGGVSRAGTEHHELCVADSALTVMRTDSRKLFEAGLELAAATWFDALEEFDWAGADCLVAHQTSVKHIQAVAAAMKMDAAKFPLTVAEYGNMAAAAIPFTLAKQLDSLRPGMQVLLLGIGSGLNTSFAELAW